MRSVAAFAFVAAVISLSCGSSTSPSTGSNSRPTAATLTAIVNNIPWTANGPITATYTPVTSSLTASNLNVSGQDSPSTQTLMFVVGPAQVGSAVTTGTYLVGSTSTSATLTVAGGSTFAAGSGSVTIDTLNPTAKTASGTFNFVMREVNGPGTRTITSGSFSVTFN